MYSLRNKINQLFIAGFEGEDASKSVDFVELVKDGLGGVIFFTKNIMSADLFKENNNFIKKSALIPPFLSIDQEGGRIERTENIHNGKKYLSAKDSAIMGMDFVENQTEELCQELKSYGINMNFAPVLDTNTNPKNPIIGVRAYGDNPDDVIKFATMVFKIHQKLGIIPVGKHFPGHGDTSEDSHLEMPVVHLSEEVMNKSHLKPFVSAMDNGLDAIMVSHVYYSCYDENPTPASLSKNILTDLLRTKLGFKGLVISDDMVMGAVVSKDYKKTYIQAIKAGINMFIYRNTDEKLLKILDFIEQEASKDEELENFINHSFEKVLELKKNNKILGNI